MINMKKIFTFILCAIALTANAQQPVEGTTYFLPKTAVQFRILIEKTTYTPGELAVYAEKYMKMQNTDEKPSVAYRIISTTNNCFGIPDTTKQHTAIVDKKHSIIRINKYENGMLLAINAEPKTIEVVKDFKPAPKPAAVNPHDFMNADILSAGSKAKMAELIAQDIYDIRESRNQLSRGEADFMPKDGEQLKIMLANLSKQEKALMQVFEGTIVKDTVEKVITFIPEKEVNKQVLFRFSSKLGLVDSDDLSGRPIYISVTDLHSIAPLKLDFDAKKSKDDCGVYVNLPGSIRLSLYDGNKQYKSFDISAAQFGRTESISGELFGKKITTHIVLNPVTGNADELKTEPLE